MKKWIEIGQIMGSHGIRGEIKVKPLTDDLDRFYDLDEVHVENKGKRTLYPITGVRVHKGQVLMTLEGIDDRTESDKLVRAMMVVPREESVPLEEGEFFIGDLIGMTLVDPAGKVLGKILDILTSTGAVDTVEIDWDGLDKRVYVPFRKIYFPAWDLEKNVMTADIPREFLEL